MRRRNLDVLIAWLDAGRRRDREAMLALLAPGATWQGMRPEWVCTNPAEVVETWLSRAEALDDLETAELAADDRRAVLHLRAASLSAIDPSLRTGVHIGFEIDDDGRITRMADSGRRRVVFPTDPGATPRGIPEAPIVDGAPAGPGWFVLNAAHARWVTGYFGAFTPFGWDEQRFEQIGVNLAVVEPGQALCYYHREGDQEDFLIIQGEALLIIEGQERRVRPWDLVHCPPWTDHVFVGAGDGPCTLLAIGGRSQGGVVYPVDEVAQAHGAGVREQFALPDEAYAEIPPDEPAGFDPEWLPDG